MVLSCTATAVEFDAISKAFPKPNKPACLAISDFTLNISPGQMFGFYGPNGSGKTTLLKILCGILTPTSGRLQVNGCERSREPEMFRQQISALVPANGVIDSQLSVWEAMLRHNMAKAPIVGSDLATRAEIMLRELCLLELRDEPLELLSPGQRRQVAIASLLIADAPIIVVDEPTLGLDVRAANIVGGWLKEWSCGKNRLVVLATSQVNVVRHLCDQAALIDQGRLVTLGSVAELFRPVEPDLYELRIKGHLRCDWLDPCEEMTVTNQENGESTILLAAQDQSALYGALQRIFGMGMPLISLKRKEAIAEEWLT